MDLMLAEGRGFNDDRPGSLTRFDFSIDLLPLGGRTRHEIDKWIFAHTIVRNRRAAPLALVWPAPKEIVKMQPLNQHSNRTTQWGPVSRDSF